MGIAYVLLSTENAIACTLRNCMGHNEPHLVSRPSRFPMPTQEIGTHLARSIWNLQPHGVTASLEADDVLSSGNQ